MMIYLIWKFVHISAVVVFIGNILTGLFWAAHARRNKDFVLLAKTFEGVTRSDRWFTMPAAMTIVASGIALAIEAKLPILGTGWIFWPIVLFSVSGIVFAIWIAPLQRQLTVLAQRSDNSDAAWLTFYQLYRKWEFYGLIAILTPIAAMFIMVVKPALFAL